MKRVKTDRIELKAIQFILLPSQRFEPKEPHTFDFNYDGQVHVELCPSYDKLAGATVRLRTSALLSCSPYFRYISYDASYDPGTGSLFLNSIAQLLLKKEFGRDDFIYFTNEILKEAEDESPFLRPALGIIMSMPPGAKIPAETFKASLALKRVLPRSSLDLLPLQTTLVSYFVSDVFDVKQRERIMKMDMSMLRELKQKLQTAPWDLCFDEPLYGRYQRLKPLSRQRYRKAVEDFKLAPDVLVVEPALNIYFSCKENESKDTVFDRRTFSRVIPFMQIDERAALEKKIFDFLEKRAITFLTPEKDSWFALNRNYRDAKRAMDALEGIAKRALRGGEPEVRGNNVPTIFPSLTPRQKEIAQHIQKHWLTVVEGLPGTGKTQLSMWIITHYAKVCTAAFVKMMVKALRGRVGKRPEVANSIAHICATNKFTKMGPKWLEEFDVLIVEEMSMISQRLFARLLSCLPNIKKIIVVGDHRQLPPIDAGDPMGDLIAHFSSQLLTENLRVQKHLKELQEAPALICDGKASQIAFRRGGPIEILPDNVTVFDLCRHVSTLPRGQFLANFHIVCLTNDERRKLNKQVHEAWIKLGILNPLQTHAFVRGMTVFPGCKIMFLANYNKPVTFNEKIVSDPVSNGELCIVLQVFLNPKMGGVQLVVADTDEKEQNPETKCVWIHEKHGVKPIHVDWGYATTAYKTQGNEFPFVLFRVQENPGPHWTRPNAYVSVSRAKEKCWIMGRREDFLAVCARPERPRLTCFGMLLKQEELPKEPVVRVVSNMLDPLQMTLMPKDIPCVPTLEQTIEKSRKKE